MMGLCRFFLPVFCCFFAAVSLCPNAHGASAGQIATALDNPPGVTFSASNNSSWSSKTRNISGITPSGVPSFNNNYLVCSSPGKADPQKQNSFTMLVKGSGILSFSYQVSLDYYNWAELCAYKNDYEDGWLWGDSGWWDEYVDSGWDWWWEGEIYLGTETYTHTVTFAVLGPSSEWYETPTPDPDWGEKLYNKAWLDHFVWQPDEDASLLAFEPDPEEFNSFNESLTVYLLSDYDNLTFRYTTDGSTPNANSPVYDPDAGITITQNTTISAILYEGSTLVNSTEYRANYMLKTAPPQLNITQNEFQNSALLEFSSSTPGAVFYYTLNNNVPIRLENGDPGENTFKGSQVTLNETTTVQVMAWAAGLADSDVILQTFEKLPTPEYAITLDGTAANHPYFDVNANLTINAAAETTVKYQIDGAGSLVYQNPLNLTETTEICFQAKQEGKLHSNTIALKFYRTDTPFTLEPPAPGWSLFFLPGEVSEQTSADLIAQLHPIAFDTQKKIYFRPYLLRGGNSYWVFTSGKSTRSDTSFHIFPLEGIPIPSKTWLLSGIPEGATLPQDIQAQTWNGQTFQPVAAPPSGAAWLYNTSNSPAEIKP